MYSLKKKNTPSLAKGASFPYRLGAGELGGNVEVNVVPPHDDVRHAIAIVSHL
jgi:hypothetical protein